MSRLKAEDREGKTGEPENSCSVGDGIQSCPQDEREYFPVSLPAFAEAKAPFDLRPWVAGISDLQKNFLFFYKKFF